jgi:hypothetical protein
VSYVSLSSESARDDQAATVWFISFGDLLTLLVCFFFVLTPQLTFNRDESETKEGLKVLGKGVAAHGTRFAYPPLGDTGVVRAQSPAEAFERADIRQADWRRELTQLWESYRMRGAVNPLDVSIRLCSGNDQQHIAATMLHEIERSRKQLRSWSLELAASCDRDLAESMSSEKVVAVLEFSGS